jgi:hypothetical protein
MPMSIVGYKLWTQIYALLPSCTLKPDTHRGLKTRGLQSAPTLLRRLASVGTLAAIAPLPAVREDALFQCVVLKGYSGAVCPMGRYARGIPL